ncbi:MAG: type I-C CRISPR-associated protein Cas5 [Clostridia bacterium]|nr:type I-C CRISPR-associated protein Cas5 [Clostridia bacterium]
MGFQIEVWGPNACFTRPEMKVERVSYDVITPSAARGLLEAIYWHPGMKWVIDRIFVLHPIRFQNIRRNEVKSVASGRKPFINAKDDIQQRASMILVNVKYVIEAHFELTEKASPSDNAGKFTDIIRRRLERGQAYHQPCFGCREFPAFFREWDGRPIRTAYEGERDLGYMLYDMDYTDRENIRPMFFRPVMRDGVIDLRHCEVIR